MAMTAPVAQRIQQQPVEVTALGVPAPPFMGEPTMGYPNNAVYPGQQVRLTDAQLDELLVGVMRRHFSAFR